MLSEVAKSLDLEVLPRQQGDASDLLRIGIPGGMGEGEVDEKLNALWAAYSGAVPEDAAFFDIEFWVLDTGKVLSEYWKYDTVLRAASKRQQVDSLD